MDPFSFAVVTAWVLCCLAALALVVPGAALGPAAGEWRALPDFGPALVWTWMTLAIGVPAVVSVRGFNWATALLLSFAWPAVLWVIRHRGRCQMSFVEQARRFVFRLVAPEWSMRWPRLTARTAAIAGLSLIPLVRYAIGQSDARLPVPADFDTLWRTRQLLEGTPAWDPLASFSAVLTRVSAADALSVTVALRLALIALAAAAAGRCCAEIVRHPAGAFVAPLVVLLAPWAPASLWAVLLLVMVGATSVLVWRRHGRRADLWHASAAWLLAAGQVAALPGGHVLLHVSRTPVYQEHRSAPLEALRLARLAEEEGQWTLVAPPEQRLETDGRGGFLDLARFVSRFEHRAGDARFRFDLGRRRLFVFVEKTPLDVSRTARGVSFVDAQPAAYRVPRERARLAQRAKALCDDYRRTHAGAEIVYEDDVLRVYRIDT
jgi:hypothetical protein